MKIIDMQQGSKEWLDLRMQCVGASDAPVIMGISPWKTPYQLWREKIFGEAQKDNVFMARGRDMESEARRWINDYYGKEYIPVVGQMDEYPWIIASFDGMAIDGEIIEIKCPGDRDHNKARNGIVPEYYIPQLQHQMMVCGKSFCTYLSYKDGEGIPIFVSRDDEYIWKMLSYHKDFYNHMMNLTTPPLVEKDYIKRRDEEFLSAEWEWKKVRDALEEMQRLEEKYRNRLIHISSGKSSEGAYCRVSKVCRKGAIDYEAIEELKGVDLEKYRKDSVHFWKLTCEKKEE